MTDDRSDDTGWDAETERAFERQFADDDFGLDLDVDLEPEPEPPVDAVDAGDAGDEIEDGPDGDDQVADQFADDERPDAEDEDDADEPVAPGPGPTTAYAINWKTVVAVDAAMGLIVVVAGFVAMVVWNFFLGAALTALGLFYVAMVLRRGRAWRQLRRDAGL